MNDFFLYAELGLRHIIDLAGYDHIVFIIALCGGYAPRDWKHIAVLATAFTIGHSMTLALATLGIILFPTPVIEFLIPLTIGFTSLFNIVRGQHPTETSTTLVAPALFSLRVAMSYTLALLFGCIHGLGFSNYLRALLGKEASLVFPLLSFNIGLEIGQLVIMSIALLGGLLCVRSGVLKEREWQIFSSGLTFGIALTLIAKTWLW